MHPRLSAQSEQQVQKPKEKEEKEQKAYNKRLKTSETRLHCIQNGLFHVVVFAKLYNR